LYCAQCQWENPAESDINVTKKYWSRNNTNFTRVATPWHYTFSCSVIKIRHLAKTKYHNKTGKVVWNIINEKGHVTSKHKYISWCTDDKILLRVVVFVFCLTDQLFYSCSGLSMAPRENLSQCFSTFLLEWNPNKQWNRLQNPHVSIYESAWIKLSKWVTQNFAHTAK